MSAPIDFTRQPSISEFPGDAIDTAVSDLEFCTGPQATVVPMTEWMYSVVDSLVSDACSVEMFLLTANTQRVLYREAYEGLDMGTLWALGTLYAARRHLNTDVEVERRLVAHWAPFVNSAVDAGWLNIDDPEATAVLQSENLTREGLETAFIAMGWNSSTGRFSGNEFIDW